MEGTFGQDLVPELGDEFLEGHISALRPIWCKRVKSLVCHLKRNIIFYQSSLLVTTSKDSIVTKEGSSSQLTRPTPNCLPLLPLVRTRFLPILSAKNSLFLFLSIPLIFFKVSGTMYSGTFFNCKNAWSFNIRYITLFHKNRQIDCIVPAYKSWCTASSPHYLTNVRVGVRVHRLFTISQIHLVAGPIKKG